MLRQYHIAAIIQLGIFAYVAAALPYWRKVRPSLLKAPITAPESLHFKLFHLTPYFWPSDSTSWSVAQRCPLILHRTRDGVLHSKDAAEVCDSETPTHLLGAGAVLCEPQGAAERAAAAAGAAGDSAQCC